jgi:hypothetical protein
MAMLPNACVNPESDSESAPGSCFLQWVVEQRLRAGLVFHHEQQASECNDEQQHRELWRAYNANVALPQASTEGLFNRHRRLHSNVWSAAGLQEV